MSSKWVAKMHRAHTLNSQEEKLKEILEKLQISHETHRVFPSPEKTFVVDSFLLDFNLAIECWMSESRRSAALGWLERNAAFVDLKFGKLKRLDPSLRCLGYVEGMDVEVEDLRRVLLPIMGHADFMAFSVNEVTAALERICGAEL